MRVMLVDDQELIRTGFRLVLMGERGIEVVAEAGDGAEALAELERLDGACDVVLMDVRMPGMNGIEASAAIARDHPGTRVLVLTTFDLDEYATAAIRAGASGFLLKDARPSELVDAIRRVAGGDAAMAPSVMRRMIEQMRTLESGEGGFPPLDGAAEGDSAATPRPFGSMGMGSAGAGSAGSAGAGSAGAAVSPGAGSAGGGSTGAAVPDACDAEAFTALTERELEVLRLIAEGLNNAEISAKLFLSESTVKTHVGRVLAKLELRDRVHAVIYARTHGL
nr:response regulator transcription factor [Leucobacter chromiisoli]